MWYIWRTCELVEGKRSDLLYSTHYGLFGGPDASTAVLDVCGACMDKGKFDLGGEAIKRVLAPSLKEGSNIFIVEELLKCEQRYHPESLNPDELSLCFLVKWKDHSIRSISWEPRESLEHLPNFAQIEQRLLCVREKRKGKGSKEMKRLRRVGDTRFP